MPSKKRNDRAKAKAAAEAAAAQAVPDIVLEQVAPPAAPEPVVSPAQAPSAQAAPLPPAPPRPRYDPWAWQKEQARLAGRELVLDEQGAPYSAYLVRHDSSPPLMVAAHGEDQAWRRYMEYMGIIRTRTGPEIHYEGPAYKDVFEPEGE